MIVKFPPSRFGVSTSVVAGGIAHQLSVFFDGQPVNPGGYESAAASGDTGRCVK